MVGNLARGLNFSYRLGTGGIDVKAVGEARGVRISLVAIVMVKRIVWGGKLSSVAAREVVNGPSKRSQRIVLVDEAVEIVVPRSSLSSSHCPVE